MATDLHLPQRGREKLLLRKKVKACHGVFMPFIPAMGRQRQADLCGFEASLVFIKIPGDSTT